jgi:hypothetical protein
MHSETDAEREWFTLFPLRAIGGRQRFAGAKSKCAGCKSN